MRHFPLFVRAFGTSTGKKTETYVGKCDAMTEVVENIPQVRSPSPKRLRSSLGVLYIPLTHCVWCMEGTDDRHPERKKAKLSRIETDQGWRAFKRHTVLIKDSKMRERIERVATSTSKLSDPFAADIVYHYSCWMDYITNPLQLPTAGHFENVTQFEMKNLFLRSVDQIIFSDHEIRTTQSLLLEYKRWASEYGFVSSDIRGSYIKDMLFREYGDLIGFRERKEKNESELVFDRTGGGDYVDMAVNSFGISDEYLVGNVSKLLGTDIIDETYGPPWPPHINELEDPDKEQFSDLLVSLLQKLYMKGHPRSKDIHERDPKLRTLSIIDHILRNRQED